MHEVIRERAMDHREVFQSICQKIGSATFVELLVTCFGEEPTGNALDRLEVSKVVSGAELVKIYTRNRNNFVTQGEQS